MKSSLQQSAVYWTWYLLTKFPEFWRIETFSTNYGIAVHYFIKYELHNGCFRHLFIFTTYVVT